ncbi:MAG TPA: lamin tail domain-containing protein, partial [Verrucomicrobiota bacterium]|nr:lamin tail domain-containing protein [Verrucomicrobiota bacterium]
IEGVAPIEVSTIYVNGMAVNLTWSTLSNWFAYYPLSNLSNNIVISAYDYKGNYIPGSSNSLNVYLSTMPEEPKVVITEIMYNPVNQGAAFIELFNPSTNCAINLSDWRISGIGYKFPQGSILLPQNYLVLAKDITVFAATYGTNINVFDQFDGSLDNKGETITVLKPTDQGEVVVNKVRYESAKPWPQNAANGGASLQLIDVTKDNSRVINWSDGNDWRFFSYTGTLTPSTKRLILYPDVAGDIYIDDVKLVSGAIPEVGENLVRGGDFEGAFLISQGGYWAMTGSGPTQTSISTNVSHTGNSSLHIVFSSSGSLYQNIYQDTLVSESGTYTLSFWYLPSTNINKLITRFSSSFRPEANVRSIAFYTPGTNNSVAAPMPEFPPIWLNEIQPENVSGPTDNFGERDPWIEIYNKGTNSVDVSGWFLTDDYNNLTKWAFPDGIVIQPLSFLVIWADNQPVQTSGTNLHTNFRISPTNGSVALVMASNHKVYDYLNYNNLLAGYSYGYRDDDEIFYRQKFRISTPGALNATEGETLPIAINELMAANDGLVIDCINGGSPDWLELYNYGTDSYDLSGFFFTDDLDDKFKFEIPDGYVIQPKGFLVAWADNSPSKNNLSQDPNLHLNFSLSKKGETVALFSPQGNLINSFTYDAMDENEIFGRFPDGTGSIFKLIQPTPGSTNARPMIQTNYPPVIIVDQDYYVMPGNRLQFTVQVVDFDIPQQFFTFSLSNAPPGAAIGEETGLFVWQVPSNYPISTNMITIIVEDDGVPPQKSQALIRVIVTTGNHPPVIQPVDDQLVNEGITLFVMVQASDTDTPSQQLTYTLDQAPQGAYINQQTGVFQWTPTELQGPGDYTITVRVTDNGVPQMYSTVTFRIHVNEVNSAPMLLPIETQYLIVGQQLNLQVVGTDSDVPIQNLRYSIE